MCLQVCTRRGGTATVDIEAAGIVVQGMVTRKHGEEYCLRQAFEAVAAIVGNWASEGVSKSAQRNWRRQAELAQ